MDIGIDEQTFKLSNFTPYRFIFDWVVCESMEGLLQSFKYKDIDKQIETCKLIGKYAKYKGKKRNKAWKQYQKLYWNGITYNRGSNEYQELLDRAFNALYENSDFVNALKSCGEAIFIHSMGKTNIADTVLTDFEFTSRLQHLKDYGKIQIKY